LKYPGAEEVSGRLGATVPARGKYYGYERDFSSL